MPSPTITTITTTTEKQSSHINKNVRATTKCVVDSVFSFFRSDSPLAYMRSVFYVAKQKIWTFYNQFIMYILISQWIVFHATESCKNSLLVRLSICFCFFFIIYSGKLLCILIFLSIILHHNLSISSVCWRVLEKLLLDFYLYFFFKF